MPDVVRAAAATADAPDDARRATTRQACEAELPKLAPALATVHGAKPTLEHAADALGGDLSPRRRDATEALLRSLVAALATGRGARAPQLWEGAVAVRARFHGPVRLGLNVATRPVREERDEGALADDEAGVGGWLGSSLGFGCRLRGCAPCWRGWRRARRALRSSRRRWRARRRTVPDGPPGQPRPRK